VSDDPQLRDHILLLTARTVAMRDILARILAHEAQRSDDPDAVLRHYSEAGDARIEHAEKRSPSTFEISEAIRVQTDWILAAAKVILEGGSV
jgi:hypothetical protein